ncbi:MAG: hypothetical protein JW893_00365 [Candidatus Omnitrophica bacterium]|nr:hypothetical protein [Candidatus Omnitrophota bacterium]
MDVVLQFPAFYAVLVLRFFAGLVLLTGFFCFVWPAKSIGFYIWVMDQFNWAVRPKDENREVRTTRFLGLLLICLGAMTSYVVMFMPSYYPPI